MHWCTSGQDNKKDCAEVAVPELQALLSAPDQGIFASALLLFLHISSMS